MNNDSSDQNLINQPLLTSRALVFLLISSILTVVITAVLSIWLKFSLYSFSLWIILPIGGAFVGLCGSYGYFYGLYKSNIKYELKHYLTGAVVGLISYLGIFYFTYSITYLDANNNINYNFTGDPISNYEIGGEPITFTKYIELTEFVESTHTIYTKYNRSNTSYQASAGQNKIEFYLQLAASLIGGFFCGTLAYGNEFYCRNCKIYGKNKELMKMNFDEFGSIYESFDSIIENPKEFLSLTNQYSNNKNLGSQYFDFQVKYCPTCFDCNLTITPFVIKNNKTIEVTDKKMVVKVPATTASAISQLK